MDKLKTTFLMICFVVGLYITIAPLTSYWLATEVYAYLDTAVPEWLTYITNLIQ